MKILKTFLLLIFTVNFFFAQKITPVKIYNDSLKNGKSINIGNWYFQSNDDSLKGIKAEIDSNSIILSSKNITDSAKTIKWNGRGWFKREVEIDSALYGEPVAFTLAHYGASEVYLNGKLVNKWGKLLNGSEEFFHPQAIPFIANFPDTNKVVLAVRYSNYKSVFDSVWFNKWIDFKGFTFKIQSPQNSVFNLAFNKSINAAINSGLFGLFFSLALLYMLIFAFYSHNLENLFFALFTLCLGVAILTGFLDQLITSNIKLIVLFKMLPGVLLVGVFLFYVLFLYRIFYPKMPKIGWVFSALAIVISILNSISSQNEMSAYLLFGFIAIIAIEGIRVIIFALKRKQENVWVIGSGVILFGAFIFLLFAINIFNLKPNQYVGLAMLFLGVFSLPVSMAIYLAKKIADTNKDLEIKIDAIQKFTERELEIQKRNAELELKNEKDSAKAKEAELRAEAAELQAKAADAQSRAIQAENERKTKELEEARELQLSMLPKELPNSENYDIAVFMQTATEVGGDYYDFFVDENDKLTIAVGDATGHGLNAGTMVTATKSLLSVLANKQDILHTFAQISSVIKGMHFRLISMCLAILKFTDNKLTFSSAGIPPILIYRANDDIVEEHLLRGMPLGTKKLFPYELRETELHSGDTVLIMSDGFPELFNEKKEMLGYSKVQEIFKYIAKENSETIISHLKQKINEWLGNQLPDDDITFVVVKKK